MVWSQASSPHANLGLIVSLTSNPGPEGTDMRGFSPRLDQLTLLQMTPPLHRIPLAL